jgi:hypothetical protein
MPGAIVPHETDVNLTNLHFPSAAEPQPKREKPVLHHHRDAGREKKSLFAKNQQLQLFDFIEAKFAILILFEFFLMTAEFAWFDRSRSLTAGFLDGLQFRARRGITTSGILHSRAS